GSHRSDRDHPQSAPARDASGCVGDASRREEITMLQRPWLLFMIIAAFCTSAAPPDKQEPRPNEVPGWGRVIDPWRDCDVSLDRENERLTIQLPGTPHVLIAEVPQLPMNAPLVARRIPSDFNGKIQRARAVCAGAVQDEEHDPYHGAGL